MKINKSASFNISVKDVAEVIKMFGDVVQTHRGNYRCVNDVRKYVALKYQERKRISAS
ncbi:MAG: hypothetical protein ACTHMM_09585 [Agriterribacter sp.]